LLFDVPVADALALVTDVADFLALEIDPVPVGAERVLEVFGIELGAIELFLGVQERDHREQQRKNGKRDDMAMTHGEGLHKNACLAATRSLRSGAQAWPALRSADSASRRNDSRGFRICLFYHLCARCGKGDSARPENRRLHGQCRPLQWCLD